MITEREIDESMTQFLRDVKDRLPEALPIKPFIVTVIETKTDSVPFETLLQPSVEEDELPPTLGVPKAAPTSVTPNEGPIRGGQGVSVIGNGFITGAKVFFASSEASGVTFIDDKKITCTTPSHSQGPVNVKVQNISGDTNSEGSLTNGYTYVAPPQITNVQPSSGPTSGGTQVTISGLNLSYVSTVNWGGASIPFVFDGTNLHVTAPAHGGGFISIVLTNKFNDTGGKDNAFKYISPPDNYQWFTAIGHTPTDTGFDNGGVKRFQIAAYNGGTFNSEYQGYVNVSTIFIGPAVSFNDSPNIDFPIQVINGIANLDIQAFCIDHGASTVQSLQFRARDAQFTTVTGDSPLYGVSNLPDLATGGHRTGGGGGGGVNQIGWVMGYAEAHGAAGSFTFGPWSWEGITLTNRQVKIQMKNGSGFVIDYNGPGTLEHVYVTQPTSFNGFGVSHSPTVNFVHGEATANVSASYTGSSGFQSYAYFYLKATANSVSSSSPQCSILNHL
jgi:hypothetical protein